MTIEGLEHKDTIDNLELGERTYGYGWALGAPNMTNDGEEVLVDPEKFLGF